jgi:hypothetical protein
VKSTFSIFVGKDDASPPPGRSRFVYGWISRLYTRSISEITETAFVHHPRRWFVARLSALEFESPRSRPTNHARTPTSSSAYRTIIDWKATIAFDLFHTESCCDCEGDDISSQVRRRPPPFRSHSCRLQVADIPPSQTKARALTDAEVQTMGVGPEETVLPVSEPLVIFTLSVVCRYRLIH